MNNAPENIAGTVAALVQAIGAAVACLVLVGWAWTGAAGSLLGFVLLFLLGMLFVAPIIAWGLPAVALAAGLIAQGFVALIHWRRSRVVRKTVDVDRFAPSSPSSIGAVLASDLRVRFIDPAAKLSDRQPVDLTRRKPEPPRQQCRSRPQRFR